MNGWRAFAVVALLCVLTVSAEARMITVPTAAGINITVAPEVAGAFQGFIRDVVGRGYKPRQIHCFATKGHVRNSNHYRGMACDFDQSGWGKTAGTMYRVSDLARKWGFRDGCSFRDCGHIDVARGTRPVAGGAYAAAVPHDRDP